MSEEPKRFDSVIEMLTHDCHKYALEVARLKAEVSRLKMEESKLLTLCETYEGDLERLRKAGDDLYKSMLEIGCNEMADNFQYDAWWGSMRSWQSAKEGKPSEQKSPSFIEDLGNGVEKHDLLFRYPSKETPPHA